MGRIAVKARRSPQLRERLRRIWLCDDRKNNAASNPFKYSGALKRPLLKAANRSLLIAPGNVLVPNYRIPHVNDDMVVKLSAVTIRINFTARRGCESLGIPACVPTE